MTQMTETVFDMNHFDKTVPGPFEWDSRLLAASGAPS